MATHSALHLGFILDQMNKEMARRGMILYQMKEGMARGWMILDQMNGEMANVYDAYVLRYWEMKRHEKT